SSATTPHTPSTPTAPHRQTLPILTTIPESSESPPPTSPPPSPTLNSSASSALPSTVFPSSPDFSDDENMPTGHEEDRLSSFGPVNAGNWKEWREALQGCLEMLGFDKSMDESEPVAPESASRYSTEMVNYRRALKDWTKDTASTTDIIRRHSGSVNTVYLTKGDTPKKWLENLAGVYDVENVMDGAFLVEAFFAEKFTGGSLTAWLSRFAELAEKVNVCYEASIPKDNKRAIFDRILRDSIIIRIGDDWRKELGDVKPSATTADVVGVLTRKYDFHVTSEKREGDQALLLSNQALLLANATSSALVITPLAKPQKKVESGGSRGKSKFERALEGVLGAICKLFVGWSGWPGGISASGRFLVVKGMCYRCLDFGHLPTSCPFTNDNAKQIANQTAVLLHYKIKLPGESLNVRLKNAFCGDGWLGGQKGTHAAAGNGKWTRKGVAGTDGKIIGAGENHGYLAGGDDVYAAADSEDDETLFANVVGSLSYTEAQLKAFDRHSTAYHVATEAKPGAFEDDDIWLTFAPSVESDSGESDEGEMPSLVEETELLRAMGTWVSSDLGESDEVPGLMTEEETDDFEARQQANVDAIRATLIAASPYPSFDVQNAFYHARLDHSAFVAPHAPFDTSPLMPDQWAAEVATELARIGA
ncbi:hypothetical protein P7C70_g9280, partial [Phenoliferia sp. Uapishka_3]